MRRRLVTKTNGLLLFLFILAACFFILSVKDHAYLGIRVKKQGDEWVIKKIQSGGAGSQMDIKTGDKIISIDNQAPEQNPSLTKWLIVEGISEMQHIRAGKCHEVTFPKGAGEQSKQLLFTFMAFMCLSILFILPTFSGLSTTYRLFSLFVTSLAFLLLAVVPSSMGIDLARVIIVAVVSLFPLFVLSFSDYSKGYLRRVKKLTKFMGLLSGINVSLLFLNLFGFGNYFISEYLAIGIF